MGFSRQGYWSGLSFPSPGDLPDPGIRLASLASPALARRFFTTSSTWECVHELEDTGWVRGIKTGPPALQAASLPSQPPEKPQ